jgi:hypothetical protein
MQGSPGASQGSDHHYIHEGVRNVATPRAPARCSTPASCKDSGPRDMGKVYLGCVRSERTPYTPCCKPVRKTRNAENARIPGRLRPRS